MSKYFALINNKLVQSVIVADDSFLTHIDGQYDFVIDVTDQDRPTAGDSYYPDTGAFVPNQDPIIDIPVDPSAPYLNQGTDVGFEPFQLSQYTVSYADGMVTIGCKQYSAIGLLDCLYKVLIEHQQTVDVFTTVDGPAHGAYGITWDDTQKLYDALVKVKLQ